MAENQIRPPVQTATDIIPIAKFKAQASTYLNHIRENNHPLVITQHGKAAAVLLSPEEFDRLQKIIYERYFLGVLAQGQTDALQGRTIPHEEVKQQLHQRYSQQKRAAHK
ncbi:MAG: type II toxin-antitoxin system Phd/YefM family antitoxin [Bdellovibrio sp.]|nr:type II toxin-antitoxin system Phd/YefM family antitoxin [Bdellovibrio sp.]